MKDWPEPEPPDFGRDAVRVMAFAIIGMCVLTFIGQALRIVWMYRWIGNPGMAVNTALCLFLVALCILILARK